MPRSTEFSPDSPHLRPLPQGRNAASQRRSEAGLSRNGCEATAGLSKEDAQRQVRGTTPIEPFMKLVLVFETGL